MNQYGINPDDRLEDILFMAETGENLEGVARRLGISDRGVEMFLARRGRRDLISLLTRRNPRDHHHSSNMAMLGDWG